MIGAAVRAREAGALALGRVRAMLARVAWRAIAQHPLLAAAFAEHAARFRRTGAPDRRPPHRPAPAWAARRADRRSARTGSGQQGQRGHWALSRVARSLGGGRAAHKSQNGIGWAWCRRRCRRAPRPSASDPPRSTPQLLRGRRAQDRDLRGAVPQRRSPSGRVEPGPRRHRDTRHGANTRPVTVRSAPAYARAGCLPAPRRPGIPESPAASGEKASSGTSS